MNSPALQKIDNSTPAQLAQIGHWAGSLNLTLALSETNNKTVLKAKQQNGPYTVQRSLYPENNGICHLILLHPPGGLVEGDNLNLNVDCLAKSHSLITTPSAGKVYQCQANDAGQIQKFTVRAGAKLEWFPQEMILYNKSLSALSTEIDLVDDGQFAGWEIVCLGRQIANDFFQQGRVVQSIALSRNSKPVLLERFDLAATDLALRSQKWGLADNSVFGTFIMTGVSEQHCEMAQTLIDDLGQTECCIGLTLLNDVLVCRGLSNQSRHLKKTFSQIWSALRREVLGVAAHEPRIWST